VNSSEVPFAAKFNNARKYVASKTLTKLDWNNSELINGDVPEGIKRIKEQDGPEIQIHGSGNVSQEFARFIMRFYMLIEVVYTVIFYNGLNQKVLIGAYLVAILFINYLIYNFKYVLNQTKVLICRIYIDWINYPII